MGPGRPQPQRHHMHNTLPRMSPRMSAHAPHVGSFAAKAAHEPTCEETCETTCCACGAVAAAASQGQSFCLKSISVFISTQLHMLIYTQMALELQVHFCTMYNTKSYVNLYQKITLTHPVCRPIWIHFGALSGLLGAHSGHIWDPFGALSGPFTG